MFTRHDELRESEKALSCMAEYAMRCFEWRINEILKKRKKTPSLFLKNYHSFFFFFFKNNKILQRLKVFSRQSSPVITILRRTIVASIVEIAMPAAKRVAKFHLAKNTRRDRADRVIAPLPSSEQPRKMLASVHIDSYRRGEG